MRFASVLFLAVAIFGLTALSVQVGPVNACSSTYKLTVTPTTATIPRGSNALYTISATGAKCLTSIRVLVGASISPTATNGPALSMPSHNALINLSTPLLIASTTTSTPTGTYTITVRGDGVQAPVVGVVKTAAVTLIVT